MSLLACSGCSTRYASGLERCPHCGSVERVEEGGGGSRLPFLDMACSTAGCRAEGVVRRIHKPMIVPGVVEQTEYACVPCGAVMMLVGGWPPPGIGDNMPKISRHGGATNAAAEQPPAVEGAAPAVEGSEQPSAGSSSETSSEKPPTSSEPSDPVLPKRARTTASRSGKGRAGSSTARTTGSSTEADEAS